MGSRLASTTSYHHWDDQPHRQSAANEEEETHQGGHFHEKWQSHQDRQRYWYEEEGDYEEEWFPEHLPRNQRNATITSKAWRIPS